jgi:MoxR-like ATPase
MRERERLRLTELKPRPLTTFVRNQLIDQVYLPFIGDNLAKQMGTVGDTRRTDQMGLLLLISPPGYGKTTLVEYLAQRLGLVFVKINCPTLGHAVTSIDPAEAPNATARQELEKLNLALEMGNNVMLYLDDIQHSSPELLQKFISLADAQRRIEGVWQGRTRTYDFRGKRFCIVMAGNPYTESGEVFKIPDMLANRADIYNLGDILGGKQEAFALSYLENALTSNPVLAPLANRDKQDVYRLIRLAQGEEVPGGEFSHAYSASEMSEIQAILKKLFRVRDVLLKVNQQYIASAAQAADYRTEPPFKLQGSYRNMNKLAEKVVAVMNEEELENLIADHYQGEAQTLTSGAEENLLKFAELRGKMTPAQKQRWEEIKKTFNRLQSSGDPQADPVSRVVNQLSGLGTHLASLRDVFQHGSRQGNAVLLQHLGQINAHLGQLSKLLDNKNLDGEVKNSLLAASQALSALPELVKAVGAQKPEIRVVNQLPGGLDNALRQMVETIDQSLIPMAKQIGRLSRMDFVLWERLKDVSNTLKTAYPDAFSQARQRRSEEDVPVLEEVAK